MPARMRRIVGLTAVVALVSLAQSHAYGASGGLGNGGSSSGGVTTQGRVYATAALHGGVVTVTSGAADSAPRGPVCQWTKSLFNAFDPGLANVPTEIVETGTDGWYYDPTNDTYVDAPGPGIETLYWVQCPNLGRYLWVPHVDSVDRGAMIDAALNEMYDDIPLPGLDINPRPDVGSVVNVGLWLAVDDPGAVSAVAEVGPVWASVTARFTGTTWDMGNGEVVECPGLGVPYPVGSNTFEQGPCGYTYTEQPPIDGYTVTVTGHWEVRLVTSDGVNQMLDPIEMPYSFAYDVDEIVTVGEA
jgi:hypothetical protein